MTEDQLSALLRTVKRYEQPPPGYFDQLLREVQRRQRSELLRMPLWKIAWERLQTLFGEHSMGPVSYGAAMAGLVVLGVTAIGVITPTKVEPRGGAVVAQNVKPIEPAMVATTEAPVPSDVSTQALPLPKSGPNQKALRRFDAGYVPVYPAPPAHHFQD
jgi:hypothetical protein